MLEWADEVEAVRLMLRITSTLVGGCQKLNVPVG